MAEMETSGKSLAIVSIIIMLVLLSGCIGIETKDPGKNVSKVNTSKGATLAPIDPNDSVAPSQVSYLTAERGPTWINWTWENPKDKDYSHAIIFIDGKFKINVSSPVNYYNLTKLKYDTQYRIGIRTEDRNRNMNPEWVNITISTLPKPVDLVPPDTVWYLEYTAGSTWINWTWENPADSDYAYANVWVDGMFAANVTKPKDFYLKKDLAPSSTHRIIVRTVDTSKNMNPKSIVGNATTLDRSPDDITPPGPISELLFEADQTYIKWWWTFPDDSDYSYANVWVDGKFAANVSKPTNYYKETDLLPDTEHNISVRTVDTSKNMNLESVDGTARTLQ